MTCFIISLKWFGLFSLCLVSFGLVSFWWFGLVWFGFVGFVLLVSLGLVWFCWFCFVWFRFANYSKPLETAYSYVTEASLSILSCPYLSAQIHDWMIVLHLNKIQTWGFSKGWTMAKLTSGENVLACLLWTSSSRTAFLTKKFGSKCFAFVWKPFPSYWKTPDKKCTFCPSLVNLTAFIFLAKLRVVICWSEWKQNNIKQAFSERDSYLYWCLWWE